MSESGATPDEERRVEELLRVNSALAAEVRSLTLGRTSAPRSAAMPTSRRLASLREERDTLSGQLEQARSDLAAREKALAELGRQNHELVGEVARLRSGYDGALRRLRARLRGLRR